MYCFVCTIDQFCPVCTSQNHTLFLSSFSLVFLSFLSEEIIARQTPWHYALRHILKCILDYHLPMEDSLQTFDTFSLKLFKVSVVLCHRLIILQLCLFWGVLNSWVSCDNLAWSTRELYLPKGLLLPFWWFSSQHCTWLGWYQCSYKLPWCEAKD